MTRVPALATLTAAFGVLVACAPAVRVTTLSPATYPAKAADTPIRLYAEQRPRCPYEELALISSRRRNVFISMEDVTEALRVRARALGGDAVIGVAESVETRGGMVHQGGAVSLDRDPVLRATIIRFKSEDCRE